MKIIKQNKLSRSQIEGDLTCSSNINLESLYALCIIYNINIFVVYHLIFLIILYNKRYMTHILF